MRKETRQRLVGVACGLATLGASQTALAVDQYLELEPPKTLTGRGYGYNSVSREFVLRQCVQFGGGLLEGSGASGDNFKFSSIVSNSQLADEMGLAVTAKFSASMGVASASASSKLDFFRSTQTNFLTHTILARYNNAEPMKYIAGEINLKPEYLAMVGTPAFRQQCGDYLIIGEQKGRWFYGTVQLSVRDTATESRLAADGLVGVQYATFAAEVGVNTINKLKQASKTQDLQIHVTSSGTDSASLTVEQFLAQVQAFPGKDGPKQTYKLMAVPYEDIVANWPATDPLAPLTAEDKLNKLAEVAYGLTALIEDSDFVAQHSKLFALGTTPLKRLPRQLGLKNRRAWYQSQLDDLRERAKDCDVDWAGKPACESLYNAWKDFDSFIVAEYSGFPVRYVSDCYAARDASDGIQSALRNALGPTQGQFSNTKGDREMGGGPVKFTSYLSFMPDFTGGDPLATRKLLATLRVKMREAKADNSTFETTLKVPVVDLSQPDLSQGAPMTMGQCAYRGLGVKAELLSGSTASCDLFKGNAHMYDNCVKGLGANKYHGELRGTTGKDPRTETFNKNSAGVLASMQCTVDSKSSDDTPAIGCSAIGLRSIQLDLVNTQDVAADKWVAPKQPDVKKPAVKLKIDRKHASALAKLLAPRRAPAPGKRQICQAGLVNADGRCVPPLRQKKRRK